MAKTLLLRVPVLALACTVGLTGCTPLDDVMVAVFGRSMRDQSSFDPYENPVDPPPGTVPFSAGNFSAAPGQLNTGQADQAAVFPPPFTQVELARNDPVVVDLANPIPASAESLARGQELYARSCAPCHGDDGVGANAYIAEVHPLLQAYNLSGERVRGLSDGYIYGMIRVGRGLMPPYGMQIAHFDRWHIVNYVRQLQQQAAGPGGGSGQE